MKIKNKKNLTQHLTQQMPPCARLQACASGSNCWVRCKTIIHGDGTRQRIKTKMYNWSQRRERGEEREEKEESEEREEIDERDERWEMREMREMREIRDRWEMRDERWWDERWDMTRWWDLKNDGGCSWKNLILFRTFQFLSERSDSFSLPRSRKCTCPSEWIILPRTGLICQKQDYSVKNWIILPKKDDSTKNWCILPKSGFFCKKLAFPIPNWISCKKNWFSAKKKVFLY